MFRVRPNRKKGKTQPRMRHLPTPVSRDPPPSPPPLSGAKSTQPHHHNSRHHHHQTSTRTRYDPLKAPNCSPGGDRAPPAPPPHGPGRSSVSAASAAAAAARGDAAAADYYASVSEDPSSSSPRASPSSYDYLREMWPMALPPGNVAGTTALYKEAETTDTSPFQYGDSVTMTTASPVHAHSSRPAEYDTHIYETPKYLRREKAATLRMKGVKTQCFDGVDAAAAGMPPDATQQTVSHSRTLPRDLSSNSRRS